MESHVFSRAVVVLALFASLAVAQTSDEIAAPQLRGSASVPAYAEYDRRFFQLGVNQVRGGGQPKGKVYFYEAGSLGDDPAWHQIKKAMERIR